MAEERYILIEHTADLAFVAYGKDLGDLFENAAFALFDVYADLSKVEEKTERTVNIQITKEAAKDTETDYEQLLVKWLNELLYLNEVEDLLFKRFKVAEINGGKLRASAFGEKFIPGRHVILTPLKAVTYHRIEVRQEPGRWHARVVVDL
ncbi:MAG: archease [Candidatus Brocadiales bacterium]|nr:archease [Candidatus Bathyanammoxibius amoris]